MAKFTVEYKRTVRVRQYETLTIGWMEEFDTDETSMMDAFEEIKGMVNYHIHEELGELTNKKG